MNLESLNIFSTRIADQLVGISDIEKMYTSLLKTNYSLEWLDDTSAVNRTFHCIDNIIFDDNISAEIFSQKALSNQKSFFGDSSLANDLNWAYHVARRRTEQLENNLLEFVTGNLTIVDSSSIDANKIMELLSSSEVYQFNDYDLSILFKLDRKVSDVCISRSYIKKLSLIIRMISNRLVGYALNLRHLFRKTVTFRFKNLDDDHHKALIYLTVSVN